MLKIIIKYSILALFLFSLSANKTYASNVNVYFFHGQGCPHCAKEEDFLKKIEKEDNAIRVIRYEVWSDEKTANFFSEIGGYYGWKVQGVPFTVIGEKTIGGYLNEEVTGKKILDAISSCREGQCPDLVDDYLKKQGKKEAGKKEAEEVRLVSLPFFGEVDIKRFSLPIITIIIGGLDGFNPCALWVLLFLISMLIGMNEKKKMLILGSAFIITSAVFYFFILAAWLNILIFIGYLKWIRFAIGAAALYAGYKNIDEYYFKDDKKCEVVDENKRKKIFAKVKEIVAKEKIWIALGGIILLAISVNMFELICSAGLPAVYTQILASSNLSKLSYFSYLLLYVFVFVLNEIIIFSIAFYSFKMRAINPKFIKWFGIFGGVIMVILGFLLIFKPSWLMFG